MKVLLIGGRGFVGKSIKKQLTSNNADINIVVGTRSPVTENDFFFDIRNSNDFTVLHDFDIIINCSDTFIATPHPIIEYCLYNNLIFVETTAENKIIEEILFRYREPGHNGKMKEFEKKITGTVIVGLGIFPGISNIIARYLLNHSTFFDSIEIGIKTNFFSGAGKSMSKLMVEMLSVNTVYYLQQERQEESAMSQGILFPIFRNGKVTKKLKSLKACFAESTMLHFSTNASYIACYYIPSSKLIYNSLKLLKLLIPRVHLFRKSFLNLLYFTILLVRNKLLNRTKTPVTIFCIANRKSSDKIAEYTYYKFKDGIETMSLMLSVTLKKLSRNTCEPGIYLPDEWISIEELSFLKKKEVKKY